MSLSKDVSASHHSTTREFSLRFATRTSSGHTGPSAKDTASTHSMMSPLRDLDAVLSGASGAKRRPFLLQGVKETKGGVVCPIGGEMRHQLEEDRVRPVP